ncbi:hypothetical protein QBC47DRAFT_193359 [Echria macrotheca]|uniref:Uncharacterized protein n=1 Tax=Echria macrotheca TaxID=438768 RepID=A0AAJ0BCC8_9PEZI|nr:hypothetical protein QBC47DRAFT_193359 [Echria macrotheca]
MLSTVHFSFLYHRAILLSQSFCSQATISATMSDRFNHHEFDKFVKAETPALVEFIKEWAPEYLDEKNYLALRQTFCPGVTKDGRLLPLGKASGSVSRFPELTTAPSDSHEEFQQVTAHMNPEIEGFYPFSFFTDKPTSGFAECPRNFVSPRYPVSLITTKTLDALQIEPIIRSVKTVLTPRGRFQPAGITSLFLNFAGRDVGYVNFLVLDVEPNVLGTFTIIGKPDIDRIFGPGWTPSQTAWLKR